MGWDVSSIKNDPKIFVREVHVHIVFAKGKCTNCGKEFDLKVDLVNEDGIYSCTCHKFILNLNENEVSEKSKD
jgi:hypothetical protein